VVPKLTRGQKILALVAALIVLLYISGVAFRDGSQPTDPSQNALVRTLGGWFGSPDQAAPEELAAPCLSGGKLTIKASCVVTVRPSDKDLRNLFLVPDKPVHVKTRAPHDDAVVEKDAPAGEQFKVAVDGDGVDVTLTCDDCTVKVGE
jgi:hypothetical protein